MYHKIVKDRKKFVEKVLLSLGCKIVDIELYYNDNRTIFEYKREYYRIDTMSFNGRTFIVLEWADTIHSIKHNIMEDIDPFPCDLSDEEIIKEIKYALEIEPYPERY